MACSLRRVAPACCLRTSSMTFSSASLSACEVDDVAATAAGTVGLLRAGGGGAACWRVAGARAGAGAAPKAAVLHRRGCGRLLARPPPYSPCAVFGERRCGRSAAVLAVEPLAQACGASADSPTASARLRRQCGRSQCGCAGGRGHGFPLRRQITLIAQALGLFD